MIRPGHSQPPKAQRKTKHEKTASPPPWIVIVIGGLFFVIVCFAYYSHTHSRMKVLARGAPSLVCIDKTIPIQQDVTKEEYKQHQLFSIFISTANIPHPDKIATGGEDAYFISDDHYTFGVFDGVGGWNYMGIDPGTYSRALAETTSICVEEYDMRDPLSILCVAEERASSITGSATACLLTVNGTAIHAANLGDSGFFVLRGDEVIFQSEELQHEFNFPYQIGSYGDGLDGSDKITVAIEEGDIVVMGSDGLFDNLFVENIVAVLKSASPKDSASDIADAAFAFSIRPDVETPFHTRANQVGWLHLGGKSDDITVIVAYITAK